MTETIQRAARAICKSDAQYGPGPPHNHCVNTCIQERNGSVCPYQADATACIETLLDPSEEAVEAAAAAVWLAEDEHRSRQSWLELPDLLREPSRIRARAAIRAYHMSILGREGIDR